MQIYQDIWVNGIVEKKGIRDCEGRYKLIAELCKKFNRPITVLDIGANLGYNSFRLSSEFNCTSVMIEGSEVYHKALLDLIGRQNCSDKLVLLGSRVNLGSLQELSKCEHFDVVLAMRVVHHFHEPFADVIDTIISLGDFIFLELPTAGEDAVRAKNRVQRELSDHSKVLTNYKYNKVDEFPIHVGSTMSPMYLVENYKKVIRHPFYGSPRNIQHSVESTFDIKRFVKRDPLKRGELVNEWVPGINLYTYHMLNGLFPDRQKIAEKIKKYTLPSSSPLTDISPWNFILSGEKVQLIDHTSVNNSLNKPFKKPNPQYCLLNTALCIYAEVKSLRKMVYNRKPFATKKLLLRRTARELLNVIKECLKKVYDVVRKFIEILFF